MQDQTFQFDAPAFTVTKSYRGASGEMFVEGIASTVDIDQTGERMSPEVIAKMAARLIGCPLREEHQKGYLNRLGEIVKADVVNDDNGNPALWIKAKLHDWSGAARDTFDAIKSGVKLGLSVAGKIKPGGLIKQFSEHLGKYVPTYVDVEPTEVSVTDHPANLATFALAVTKSLPEGFYDASGEARAMNKDYNPDEFTKDVTNANDSKPKDYKDVASDDFLDPENYKYPADEKHLMPALKYFNHEGQRAKGGYSESKWATMGHKLARKLTSSTGNHYEYDASSETVKQTDTKKTQDVKEVKTDMNKGNLVSKQYSAEIKDLLKQFGKTVDDPAAPETPAADAPAAPAEPATPAPEGDVAKSTSTIESLLSDIASSLSTLTSGQSSSSSTSTPSTSTGSKTSTTSTPTHTTSTDKGLSSTGSTSSDGSTSTDSTSSDGSSSSDDSELENCMTSMGKAIETMKQLLAKRKSSTSFGSTSTPTSTGSTTSTPTSTTSMESKHAADGDSASTTDVPVSTTSTDSTTTSKSLAALHATVMELKKAVDDLKTRAPQRKGIAVAMEKRFENGEEPGFTPDPDVVAKMKSDKSINWRQLHDYRNTGALPKGWATA